MSTPTPAEAFESKARKIHGDRYDYSRVVYTNNKANVTIVCRACGNAFLQQPNSHLSQGSGCPNKCFPKPEKFRKPSKASAKPKATHMPAPELEQSPGHRPTSEPTPEEIAAACASYRAADIASRSQPATPMSTYEKWTSGLVPVSSNAYDPDEHFEAGSPVDAPPCQCV